MAPTRKQFDTFVKSLGLKHFSADELLVNVGQHTNRPNNPVPDRSLWPNIVPTILLLDALRAELGKAVKINSAYRGPAYNKAIGGRPASQHQDFRAIDFKCSGKLPATCAKLLRSWRGRPFYSPVSLDLVSEHAPLAEAGLKANKTAQGTAFVYSGGIGVYKTFVHVDCRGVNKDWSGAS